MRKKRAYLIVGKKSKFIYGAFERTPEGKKKAEEYKKKLDKNKEAKYVIK
jgi:hypothetical protein